MSEHPSPSSIDFAHRSADASPAAATVPVALEPAIVELLSLFAGPLSGVRFPDIDHATLSELASEVELAQAEVEQVRALLTSSLAQLEARRAELHARAQRAKAYARVYAEGNAALQAELDRIVVPKPGPQGATSMLRLADSEPKKRGRPRKVREPSSLFEAPSMLEAPAAE
jgi:hypothetical protein